MQSRAESLTLPSRLESDRNIWHCVAAAANRLQLSRRGEFKDDCRAERRVSHFQAVSSQTAVFRVVWQLLPQLLLSRYHGKVNARNIAERGVSLCLAVPSRPLHSPLCVGSCLKLLLSRREYKDTAEQSGETHVAKPSRARPLHSALCGSGCLNRCDHQCSA